MCFIVLDDEAAYVVSSGNKEQSDKVMADWKRLSYGLVGYNMTLYDKLYRERLDLPLDISLEDELKLLYSRYDVRLHSNDEFIGAMMEIREEYDKARKSLPHFVTWAIRQGCTVEETDRILYI